MYYQAFSGPYFSSFSYFSLLFFFICSYFSLLFLENALLSLLFHSKMSFTCKDPEFFVNCEFFLFLTTHCDEFGSGKALLSLPFHYFSQIFIPTFPYFFVEGYLKACTISQVLSHLLDQAFTKSISINEVHLKICSRCKKETTFSRQKDIGWIKVNRPPDKSV